MEEHEAFTRIVMQRPHRSLCTVGIRIGAVLPPYSPAWFLLSTGYLKQHDVCSALAPASRFRVALGPGSCSLAITMDPWSYRDRAGLVLFPRGRTTRLLLPVGDQKKKLTAERRTAHEKILYVKRISTGEQCFEDLEKQVMPLSCKNDLPWCFSVPLSTCIKW